MVPVHIIGLKTTLNVIGGVKAGEGLANPISYCENGVRGNSEGVTFREIGPVKPLVRGD